jgi:hypothetical protein
MEGWQRQEVENETRSREINEWIEARNDERDVDGLLDPFVCECGDSGCAEPINLTRLEYEAVRAEPTHFALALNHENPELDRVVDEHKLFTVVEKWLREAARIALATDPRR